MIRGEILGIFLLFPLMAFAAPEGCGMKGATAHDAVSWLNEHGRNGDPTCVTAAVLRLGAFRYTDGVELLLKYMDFVRPTSRKEKIGVADYHDHYPAVEALSEIGIAAVPAIVKYLQEGTPSTIAEGNAYRLLRFAFSEDPPKAVTTLLDAEKRAPSEAERERLRAAAVAMVNACAPQSVSACREAFSERVH